MQKSAGEYWGEAVIQIPSKKMCSALIYSDYKVIKVAVQLKGLRLAASFQLDAEDVMMSLLSSLFWNMHSHFFFFFFKFYSV